MDPIEQLAGERLRELAEEVSRQLNNKTGSRPVLWLLAEQRKRASNAIVMMIDVDPEDANAIRKIQADIKLYDDMIMSCRKLMARGREAAFEIAEGDRAAIDELVMNMSEDERRLYGLEQRGMD
jgi:hypothetical protein